MTLALDEIHERASAEITAIEAELRRRRWADDPVLWAKERLGDTLWSGQRQILEAVRDNRHTAVQSCHEIGKSYIAADVVGWWLDTNPPGSAFVVTSAPTASQVRLILWREIGRVRARGNLKGQVNQTEWKLTMPGGNIETIAVGRKPDEYDPTAFQGIHARKVLYIFDEANGIRGGLHEAAESLIANDEGKALMISNPDDPSGEFYDACRPGSGWFVLRIGAFDTPNFTHEVIPKEILQLLIGHTYVEERRKKWAPGWTWTEDGSRCVPPPDGKLEDTHPFWQSKVLGQFPVQTAAGSLIPLAWIRSAQERDLKPGAPNEMGLDVGASEGGDPTCLGWRRGPVFRVLYSAREPDTMKSTGRMLAALADGQYGAKCVKVDYIGVGRGVVDRSIELGRPVYPISVGAGATATSCLACHHEWDQDLVPNERCPKCNSDLTQKIYMNLLSQLWWNVRTLFEKGEIDIDPLDEDLASELLQLHWEPTSKGQIQVTYDNGPSPNRADALLFTFAPVPRSKVKLVEATWGR